MMRNHQGDNRPQQRAANRGGRALKAAQGGDANQPNPQPPPPPPPPPQPQRCPRCNSTNTKFCYFNNYSLSQPRYFCKSCRRYWTQGGTLRNVPVGGGCRKPKRPKVPAPPQPQPPPANQHHDLRLISRPPAPVALPASLATSSATRPSFSAQGLTMGMLTSAHNLHQALRAANPLVNSTHTNWPNLYNAAGSSLGSTGLFSASSGMSQSLPPPQANLNVGGMLGGHMALLQGMNNFQQSHLRPQASGTQQAMVTPQAQIQQRPLGSWTQGFMNNNSGAASSASMAPSTSFWGGENNAVVGDHGGANQSAAANSVFNPNQRTNNGSSNQQNL